MMGMMGVFKWLRKDIVQRDRNRRSLTPKINGLNNEAYRNALQAFIDRRRIPSDSDNIAAPNSPDKERLEFFIKKKNENDKNKNYENDKNKRKDNRECEGIHGVPHIQAPEIFEIGWVAGTEDRHIELIFAEWQTTRVSLRRHTHPDCRSAIKADLEVLTEIRHPNVLLLMATTHTDDHGLVSIFEPVDCTLFNYVHEQGERVSVQGIAKCAGSLAGALKHAHMRGYVHGAISSHCVYLATSGTVKLGGWELAGSVNSPKITREYEERLRFEIYRWLAPEIYKGLEPSKATDVYGLTLLMWEMCTMNLPWSGLSKSEVERQYVQWGRGVITDLYNFPPLLNNLLDAGLQLDVTKRTLDMSRMRRFLQTLQIQYEDVEPFYIELSSNNNNSQKPSPLSTPPIRNSPLPPRSASAQTPKRYSDRKSASAGKENIAHRFPNPNLAEEAKPNDTQNLSSFSRNETVPIESLDHILKGKNVQKVSSKNVHKSRSSEKLAPKVRKPPRKDDLSAVTDSTDDERVTDFRSNLKRLKASLASKRANFFYGSDSSQSSPPNKIESAKSRILTQVRSKDYEPHKPASHKTSFEPKQTKSSGDFNSTASRSARNQSQKSPYSYVPTAIRDAVAQPKVLNADSSSFFESTFWKTENMICISRMAKSDVNNFTNSISRCPSATVQSNKVDSAESYCTYKVDSAESNCTYTVDEPRGSQNAPENVESTFVVSDAADVTASSISRSKSLQALKEALERATDIVRSTTPLPSESSTVSSPFKSPKSFDKNTMTRDNESLFEDLYELKHDEPDSEIESIERSANSKDAFLLPVENKPENGEEVEEKNDYAVRRRKAFREEKRGAFKSPKSLDQNTTTCANDSLFEDIFELKHDEPDSEIKSIERFENAEDAFLLPVENKPENGEEVEDKNDYAVRRRKAFREEKRGTFDGSRRSSGVCESIAESMNENEQSSAESKADDRTVILSGSALSPEAQERRAVFDLQSCTDIQHCHEESKENKTQEPETSFALMVFSDKANKGCSSCNRNSALARRRSLPAALGQLRNLSNVSLGKLPIRKADLPDNTVEDLYFDDEFGDSLNVNMVLLDEDASLEDEDFLPDLLDLSDSRDYQ